MHFATKYGPKGAKEALKIASHAPAIYSGLNDQTGGLLDIGVIMGCTVAGTAIGGAVTEGIGGPIGGMVGG